MLTSTTAIGDEGGRNENVFKHFVGKSINNYAPKNIYRQLREMKKLTGLLDNKPPMRN